MPGTKRPRAEDDEAPRKKGKQHTAQPAARTVSTRSMTRTSVFNAVFQTTELLENILYFLPLKGLVVAQMVCSKWRDVITQVEHFRQALFLEPAVPKAAWKWTMDSMDCYCHTLEKLDVMPSLSSAAKHPNRIAIQAKLHPFLEFTSLRADLDMLQNASGEIVQFKDDARWRHKAGSWRAMFVTQPPALSITGEYSSGDGPTGKHSWACHPCDLYSPTGLTMAHLVDHGLMLEAEGRKVHWDSGWWELNCRPCWTDEEAEEAMRNSGSDNHERY
ncbi:hypothetical protein LTR27_000674 [Elasticomyces elasticus]|nr:hypothetical protein LTR27_000674 [Elasticomyces elasticus]